MNTTSEQTWVNDEIKEILYNYEQETDINLQNERLAFQLANPHMEKEELLKHELFKEKDKKLFKSLPVSNEMKFMQMFEEFKHNVATKLNLSTHSFGVTLDVNGEDTVSCSVTFKKTQ